jgi:NAD(P)-dependent dehydrogenase (short-subunit alcohol dehydrogenase family)
MWQMNEFEGKVAVITGAASGIGRGLAERCAQEGMRVVLADIEEAALATTALAMKDAGADVLPVVTDVSKADDIEALARQTLDAYGAVHLLCNNAGVGTGNTVWESTLKDWQWTINVNLWGVIHGLRTFVPLMLKQESDGYIVNTASIAGLLPYHFGAAYQATKHAIVAISEKLYYDMAMRGGKIGVSVLCPGWVRTNIMDSWRNRPLELSEEPVEMTPEGLAALEALRQECEAGMPPVELAEHVFQAVRAAKFYILPHKEFMPLIQARGEAILQGHNPPPLY